MDDGDGGGGGDGASEVAMSRASVAEEEVRRRPLPSGWEAHEDEDGAYYWHIKSGNIQRDFPVDMVSDG